MILHLTADRAEPLRSLLDRELRLSSTLLGRLKRADAIAVNGVPEHVTRRLTPGDRVEVDIDAAEAPTDVLPEPGELHVLYEDEALLAVHKPRGMLTHPSPGKKSGTLLNRVLAHTPHAHVLTRLDRDTTGIVLLAKNAWVQDRTEALEKGYSALAFGRFDAASGTIDAPLGVTGETDAHGRPLMRRRVGEGQAAVTHYRVEAELTLAGVPCTRLQLIPVTGRTHQLRAHCAHLGHPLLGDRLYGTEASIALSEALRLPGHLLHAGELTFRHPVDGREIALSCPDDFDALTKTAP